MASSSRAEPFQITPKTDTQLAPDDDVEKSPAYNTSPVNDGKGKSRREKIVALGESCQSLWKWLASWGVELRGVLPVALDERTDTNVLSLFFLWFTVSCNLLP